MIEAVVYDFGGVFMASPFEAMRLLSEEKGHDHAFTQNLLFGPYDEDTDHPWHQAERGEIDIASARQAIIDLGREQDVEMDLFEIFKYLGMDREVNAPMVESVRRARALGCKTAILTNNIVELRETWKKMLPVDELFDAIVDSSEVGMRKPDPRIYRHALEVLGVSAPERSVFLDDYPANVTAAERIGMIGILVDLDRSSAIARLDALLDGQAA